MKISYLKRSDINDSKWNKCINESFNGIVYAFTWYLDIVCEKWEALVFDNYKMVMPLTPGRKYGLAYLYQPHFTQQSGVFSTTKLSQEIVECFLNAIPKKYKFLEINLNSYNKLDVKSSFFSKLRTTYQLDLIGEYSVISKKYSSNTKRNIRKAQKQNISVLQSVTTNNLLELKRNNEVVDLNEEHYNILRRLISSSIQYKVGTIYGAYTQDNELCAAALFISSHGKSIFLLAASNEQGKENRAMFLIIDEFIRKYSQRNVTIDFEGSDVEGLARFYSGFGAIPCKYVHVRKNRLPWYLKLFKS